jgi:hypothetical protein
VCSFCVPTESEEGADRQALTSVDARVDDWARCQGVKGVESTGLEEVPGDGGGSGSVRAVGWSPPLPLALPSLSLSLSSPSPSTLLSVANPNDTVTTCTGHWLGLAHGVISPTIAACGGVSPRSHLHHPYPSSTHPSHNLFVHSITSIPPSPSSSTAMATSRSALSALRLSARVCARPVIARSFQSARILRQGKAQSRDSC